MSRADQARTGVAWLLLAVTAVYLVSGFGITNQEMVGPLTAGLLGKASAFRLHDALWLPFIALLAIHVAWNVSRRAGLIK
ncbi:MAG TPA: hypothetical protein VLT35_02380 [Methanocella sp.]|nr:hypothetical protein [Methanocella sp.]